MIILKNLDFGSIAAAMLQIEAAGVTFDLDNTTYNAVSSFGYVYVPVDVVLGEFRDILAATVESLQSPVIAGRICVATSAWTTTFSQPPEDMTRRRICIPDESTPDCIFRWEIRHFPAIVPGKRLPSDEYIAGQVTAILCDPENICTKSDIAISVGIEDFIGYQCRSDILVTLPIPQICPVQYATDTYWRNKRVAPSLKPAKDIENPPVADAIQDNDGNMLDGNEFCACCLRKLVGVTYFVECVQKINLCSVCMHYSNIKKPKKVYKYNHKNSILSIAGTDILKEMCKGITIAAIEGSEVLLIGDKYMSVLYNTLVYTGICRNPLLEGRKNVLIDYL